MKNFNKLAYKEIYSLIRIAKKECCTEDDIIEYIEIKLQTLFYSLNLNHQAQQRVNIIKEKLFFLYNI